MTLSKATTELARLKALNDGKHYVMKMAWGGKWAVSEAVEKDFEHRDAKIDAMTGKDYLASYKHEDHVH